MAIPGFYDDPSHQFSKRYFDGTKWTARVMDQAGVETTDKAWQAALATQAFKRNESQAADLFAKGFSQLRNAVEKATDKVSKGATQSSSVSVASDPLDQIAKLGDLKQRGLITDEEFEAKKKELLGL